MFFIASIQFMMRSDLWSAGYDGVSCQRLRDEGHDVLYWGLTPFVLLEELLNETRHNLYLEQCGLRSLASRDAVEEASPFATGAVVGLRPYATTDTSHWGTLRRPPYFCSGLAAHVLRGPPRRSRPKTFFGGYARLEFGGQFL
jgi:hypothetical protein